MDARKVQFKLFIRSPAEVDVEPLVPVFHDWIKKNALDELLIDVTEYGHVHHGPALLLVGHAADYVVDFGEGRAGLLYSRKRDAAVDVEECLLDALRRVLFAARSIETEPSLITPIRFRTDELLFRINDRLLAPNTKETFAAVEPLLRRMVARVYGPAAAFSMKLVGEDRGLFGVRVQISGAPTVAELLARIS